MKKISTVVLGLAFVLGIAGPTATFAATDPGLGAAATFSIVAQTAITGSGTISGDVGLNSTGAGITALTDPMVGGTIYSTDGVAPSTAILNPNVQANLSTANGNISSQAATASIGPVLDGEIRTPGVYDIGAGRLNGGVLTLNGAGIYIFRASSDLISSGSISLTNGARACDVYWQVNTLATINGSSFIGTIIAGTGVHFGNNVALNGRALALGGDVTLLNNTISGPTCAPAPGTLNVIKTVINNNGGTAVASDFTLNVTGTNVSQSSFVGSTTGVSVTLDAGSYSVTEPVVPAGYLQTGSGDCSGTIAAGQTKTCTITNDDIAPQLIVNKIVINDNGGTKVIANFPLFLDGASMTSGVSGTTTIGLHTVSETTASGYTSTIGGHCAANGTITLALGDVKTCTITNDDIAPVVPGPSVSAGGASGAVYSTPMPPLIDVVKVPSPLALPKGAGRVKYTYTLRNIGTVPINNVTMVGDTCSPITMISGDTGGAGAVLDVNESWVYTCSTTLTKTHTNIVTATGWANGISATDIANATVVVGIPVVPPLIHVTKVPNTFVFSAGGGMVTYTNKVTNPGTVALRNVRLVDDKCGPVKYVSGDRNRNSRLDTTETWTYTCSAKLTKTTVNTVTASGEANGLTARDFAIATVVVNAAVPKLPNTGLPPGENFTPWNVIVPAGIFGALVFCCFARRKQAQVYEHQSSYRITP